jgi:citrate lyase gamma subunit
MLRYSTKVLMLLPLVAVGWCERAASADGPPKSVTGKSVIRQAKQITSAVPSGDQALQAAPDPNASLLENQQEMTRLLTEKLRNEVSHAIETARVSDDPAVGLAALKQTLGSVKAAIDIGPEDRARMQKQLESTIQQQEVKQDQLQQQLTRALERRAQQEAQARLSEQAMLDEERLENLIDRVRSLMQEGRHGRDDAYAEAQLVADVAIDMRPGEGASTAARFDAESAHQLTRAYRLRARRADEVLETLYQVELSHIPFPDEPPLRFPPAAVWKALSERRKQHATVDLKKSTPNEKRIQKSLTETTEVSFTDNPLEEALNYLEDLHHIEIWLDKQALQDEGVATDQQITLVMTGISLRSALRLMLEPLGLTYIIEDEVMKITTQAKADEKMSARVYPVADLVIPIRTPQAPMMGGMGGGMGGMGGGMGMGGMGGGMGGMGMGGMGMGGMGGGMGMFSVPAEEIKGSK